jgi:hypothetical protein
MASSNEVRRAHGDLDEFFSALAGKFAIERELGIGGHAIVFLAQDLQLHRPVAIKVLRPELALHVRVERFVREIEISAALQHPNILPLFASGEAAGRLYYVMPFVEGETLEALLEREGALPVDEAIRLVGEVAGALYYAHSRGILHRDIKPGNILLSGGHALLADFGIARAIRAAGGSSLTSEGLVVGTAQYMSPEQSTAESVVDARSDQYALACVAYALLAGQPPFTGPTTQAIIARHLQEPPPPLRVVRPSVTPAMQKVIERALAKVPGDRWASVVEFAEQLTSSAVRKPVPPSALTGAALGVAVLVGLVVWRLVFGAGPELNENRVVVFPLTASPQESNPEGIGDEVALMIGTALEHTEPLKWLDGWQLLSPEQRRDPALVTAQESRRIARARGARWYVEGTLSRSGDFVTVVLRLHDSDGDSLLGRESSAGHLSQAPQAGLRAVTKLLPRLLAPDRPVDLAPLTDRHAGAIASWLQGEREYRRSDFNAALGYLQRAVEQDSQLAVAALRGAQAASWTSRMPIAAGLARAAYARLGLLPPRQATFARGFMAYLAGDADSAVHWLKRALIDAPDWTEAHMMLAEVYYHLLPTSDVSLDSLASVELRIAAADTGFAAPLYHLAEIAIRAGDPDAAEEAVRRFARIGRDDRANQQLSLMLRCARGRRSDIDWRRSAPLEALSAAKTLAIAGAFPGCAEDGFRSVLGDSTYYWGALLGLRGVLAAQGRTHELVTLIDSVVAAGVPAARLLHVLDFIAGVPVEPQARAAAEQARIELRAQGPRGSALRPWLLGTWNAMTNSITEAEALHDELLARAKRTSDPLASRLATALRGRLTLLRGDTLEALAQLRSVLAFGRRDALEWDLAEPLAGERLLVAEVLLQQGRGREALTAASVFDHQQPIAFLPYLPASLRLRLRAAEMLHSTDAMRYRERLRRLGWDDQARAHTSLVQGDSL